MLKRRLIFLTFLILAVCLPALSSAEALDNWYLRYSSPCSDCQLNGVTFGNNTFVAVGNSGTILSSSNGLTWTEQDFMDSGTIENLNGIAYGEDTFVAVGDHATILVSSDGETWEEITPYAGTVNDLTAIAYGNGLFVAVGEHEYQCQSNVLTSTDGYEWEASNIDTTISPQFPNTPTSIAYGNGIFVAVGEGGKVSTSNDGVTWELGNVGIAVNLSDITFGNGMFVAIDTDGLIWTSVDAITWELRNSGISCELRSIAYGSLTFVAVAVCSWDGFSHESIIITSSDGIAWTERFPEIDGEYYDLAYGKGTFVAAGTGAGGGAEIIQSDIITPSPLMAKAISSSSIVLTWKDNTDNETGFKIERKSGACGSANLWVQIAKTGENVTYRTNTGLSPDTTYSYRVRSYNADMNSDYSNCASDTTGVAGSPNAPSSLRATSVSTSRINLAWNDNSTDETGFEIYRKAGASSWTLLTTTAANVKSYADTTATGNASTKTHSYYVKACNASLCSPDTNTAVVPYKPTELAATAASSSRINLTWEDNSSNEAGFKVYRKSGSCSSTNSWSLITTTGSNVSSYSNSGLLSGRTYSYRVKAFSSSLARPYANGYSGYSNCISATTP